jgi:hypothetical protein
MKRVRYTADALKSLKRHGNMADRIMLAMREYTDGAGAHANNVKAMQGSSGLRPGLSHLTIQAKGQASSARLVLPQGLIVSQS